MILWMPDLLPNAPLDRRRRGLAFAVALACAGLPAGAVAQEAARPAPFRAVVRDVIGINLAVLQDGRRVRLQGLAAPTPVVRPPGFAKKLRDWLEYQLRDREVLVEPEVGNAVDDTRVDLTAVLRIGPGLPSLNAQALEAGLALLSCRTDEVASADELVAASQRAQRFGRGLWAASPRPAVEKLPYLNGAVIGLQQRDPAYDYRREIDEAVEAGFAHVSFIFPGFLENVSAARIDRHHPRTVRDERLIATIRYAREEKGLTVLLLPIVLLEHAGEDDWRGTIKPASEPHFWLAYDAFVSHYLDLAEHTGAEMVSIGSELSSMEDRTPAWRRLIRNARGRFTGFLTYSANWDHAHVPRFFDALDAVGMTAYFGLTESDTPTHEELVAGWRGVGEALEVVAGTIPRPLFLTELGYASQDGINKDPWNYFIAPDAIDLAEQAACFEAALEVLPGLEFLHGAYWFEFAGEGGRGDNTYSPRGKPAMEVWRRWAALSIDRPILRR